MKLQGVDRVVLCFFGDGAPIPAISTSLSTWLRLEPAVVYICENNLYGMSAPFPPSARIPTSLIRALAYDIPGQAVDGQNALAVRALSWLPSNAHAAATGRRSSSSRLSLVWPFAQRPAYLPHPRRRDKVENAGSDHCLENMLLGDGMATEAEMAEVESLAAAAVDKATEFAFASPEPPASELYKDVYVALKHTPADIAKKAICAGACVPTPVCARSLLAGNQRSAQGRDDARQSRLPLRRGHRPLWRRIRRHAWLFEQFGPQR